MSPHEVGRAVGTELANAVRDNPMNGDGVNGAVSALLSKLRHLPGVQEGYDARTAERAQQREEMYARLEAERAARRAAIETPPCPTCGTPTTGFETLQFARPLLIPCGHTAKVTIFDDGRPPLLEAP